MTTELRQTRGRLRSRRKRMIRSRVIDTRRIPKREIAIGRTLNPEVDWIDRPKVRGDCVADERPCPFVSCKHHLYLDVKYGTGAIRMNFPDLEVWEMEETCALDVADRGGVPLERVGELMNLTRERVRQIEVKIFDRARARLLPILGDDR